jgi:hypothetical protein
MSKKFVFASAAVALAVSAVAAYGAATAGPMMGPASKIARPAFHGFYDGHRDTYLNTDVSSKAEAAMMHINYSARIGAVKGAAGDLSRPGPRSAGTAGRVRLPTG